MNQTRHCLWYCRNGGEIFQQNFEASYIWYALIMLHYLKWTLTTLAFLICNVCHAIDRSWLFDRENGLIPKKIHEKGLFEATKICWRPNCWHRFNFRDTSKKLWGMMVQLYHKTGRNRIYSTRNFFWGVTTESLSQHDRKKTHIFVTICLSWIIKNSLEAGDLSSQKAIIMTRSD